VRRGGDLSVASSGTCHQVVVFQSPLGDEGALGRRGRNVGILEIVYWNVGLSGAGGERVRCGVRRKGRGMLDELRQAVHGRV